MGLYPRWSERNSNGLQGKIMARARNSKPSSQSGFTIVELMIATVIFSMVLLVCSYAIIHVGRVYYKGLITNRTQDAARKVVDDATRSVQFNNVTSAASVVRPPDGGWGSEPDPVSLCVGMDRYTYYKNQLPQGSGPVGVNNKFVLVKTTKINSSEACTGLGASSEPDITHTGPELTNGQVNMLGENMRLLDFDVNCSSGSCDIKVKVSYGDSADLFEGGGSGDYSVCKGVNSSGQFCASVEYNAEVAGRL